MGNCFRKPGNRATTANKPRINPTERSKGERFVKGLKETAEQRGNRADNGVDGTNGGERSPANLKSFTLDELKIATRNFRPDTVLGEGGFGRVFKGWIDENTLKPSKVGVGIPVAVKKSNPDSLQGQQEWESEVRFLGEFSHSNLVKLIGYCLEENQFLLVYEYMQKGSLESHLFRTGGPESLPWDTRLKIAIGAARGLAFLHNSKNSVIYRDFKSSNILLDGDFNAKLSDFGLAKFGPDKDKTHVTTRIMGTYGYAAPEYMATGHLYVKSDVYGFGVVLLEMLTGLIALDTHRPPREQNLVEYTKSSLGDKKKLQRIMDPRMEEYSLTAAFQVAQLILKCLEADPKKRPSMEEVLGTLEKTRNINNKSKGKKGSTVHQTSKRSEEYPSSNQRRSPTNHHNNGHPKPRTHSPRP